MLRKVCKCSLAQDASVQQELQVGMAVAWIICSTALCVHLGLRFEEGGEEVAVAVLVLAPVLKVLEERVQLVVRVALQVAVDADVAPVPDLHTSGDKAQQLARRRKLFRVTMPPARRCGSVQAGRFASDTRARQGRALPVLHPAGSASGCGQQPDSLELLSLHCSV